jgi:protein gp37
MSNKWWNTPWNPVTGCTKLSPGCANCWAHAFIKRMQNNPKTGHKYRNGFTPTVHPLEFDAPKSIPGSKRIFVCDMADLFHDDFFDIEMYRIIFRTMLECPQHTFFVLTKRPEQMRAVLYMIDPNFADNHPNVWCGVSVEDQSAANSRIPLLIKTNCAHRFISAEPLLGPVVLKGEWLRNLNWVIAGAETGPKARPCEANWLNNLHLQCTMAGVPQFVKDSGQSRWPIVITQYPKF